MRKSKADLMDVVTVRVPKAVRALLRKAAKAKKITMSRYAMEVLSNHFKAAES